MNELKELVLGGLIFLYIILSGCAAPLTGVESRIHANNELLDYRKEILEDNYDSGLERHRDFIEQRMLEKADVDISTVVVDAEWTGLVRQRVGEIRLNMSLRELNGVGVTFESYLIRLICNHDYYLKNYQEEKVGRFYFENPVVVAPFQTEKIVVNGNAWVRKSINKMNRLLSSETWDLELELNGEDDNGHTINVKAGTGTV
jgi:hypothetical protein